ncbi:VPLPA-CTERM sorting domain-containing protein [Mangrovimicrobium sediminis]|uniref:VPLPA-CTERM sorting domain-containing protein n=2 Tax=Mangrovimicrobium sediminis TaxID=2562682 RepID=A0A4Z0LXF2_9GAMM|nr:VPLPA-CTERM sorting domain-containing protein [Haliea sp. SAOS-164]
MNPNPYDSFNLDSFDASGIQYTVSDLAQGALKTVTFNVSAVPVPAAVWLFGSALLGLTGVTRRRKAAA